MEISEAELRKFSLCYCETDSLYHEFSVRVGISDTAMRVLYMIRMYDGACLLSEIVRLLGISKQTIHSAVKKLEKDGFLRIENYDGRKKMISFSEKGEEVAKKTVDKLIKIENEVLSLYNQEELKLFFEMENRYRLELKKRVESFTQETFSD